MRRYVIDLCAAYESRIYARQTCRYSERYEYGVTTVSRLDKIVGLFCKRALKRRKYSAKETCNLIDSTKRSHAIL